MARRLLALVAALVVVTAGCAEDDPAALDASGPSGAITVFAASSLTDAFDEIGERFMAENPDATVTFSYGASSTLVAQLAQGAPADVIATADEATMTGAVESGHVVAPEAFAANVLQVVVAAGNPERVDGIGDLRGISYVICDPAVPCGRYAARAFERAGMRPEPKSFEVNVKAVLARVIGGEVDAGLVYRTDVLAAGPDVVGIDIEGSDDPDLQNIYPIAVTTRAKGSALAKAWVDYVTSSSGREVLAARRFLPPPG